MGNLYQELKESLGLMKNSAEIENLYAQVKTELDFSQKKLKLDEECEIAQIESDRRGRKVWILKNSEKMYLKVNENGIFIIKSLQQEYLSERELTVSYFMEYSKLGDQFIHSFLRTLYVRGFLNPKYVNIKKLIQIENNNIKKRKKRFNFFSLFNKKIIYINDIDSFINKAFLYFGGLFFSRWSLFFYSLLFLASIYAGMKTMKWESINLLKVNGSFVLGMLFLFALKIVMTSLHELAHALSVKSFNREVNKGGIVSHFGIPSFFVDTNDIWMRPKFERIIVSLAGPASTFVLIMVVIILQYWAGPIFSQDSFAKILLWGILSILLNLNPLLYLDGYYILVDLFSFPLLRQKSFNLLKELIKKHGHIRFNLEEILLLAYCFISIVWTIGSIFLVVTLSGSRFISILMEIYNSNSYLIKFAGIVLLVCFFIPFSWVMARFLFQVYKKSKDKILKSKFWNRPHNRIVVYSCMVISYLVSLKLVRPNKYLYFVSFFLIGTIIYLDILAIRKLRNYPIYRDLGFYFIGVAFLYLLTFKIPTVFMIVGAMMILLDTYLIYKTQKSLIVTVFQVHLTLNALLIICYIFVKNESNPFLFLTSIIGLFWCFFIYEFIRLVNEFKLCPLKIGVDHRELASDFDKITFSYTFIYQAILYTIEKYYSRFYSKIILKGTGNEENSPLYLEGHKGAKNLQIIFHKERYGGLIELKTVLLHEITQLKKSMEYIFGLSTSNYYLELAIEELYWPYREVFEEYIGKKSFSAVSAVSYRDKNLTFFHQIGLFEHLTKSELENVVKKFTLNQFKKGDVFTKQGEQGEHFFVILRGQVQVYKELEGELNNVAVLTEGDIFGERTLYLGKPRNATVIALTDGEIFKMRKDDFKYLLDANETFKLKVSNYIDQSFKFLSFLKEIPLFHKLPDESLRLLGDKIEFKVYPKGEHIFKEGEIGTKFYIIKSGSVKIYKENENGEETLISMASTGEYFGEMALFNDLPRSASVEVLEETVCFVINRESFQDVFQDDKMMEKVVGRRKKENQNYFLNKGSP